MIIDSNLHTSCLTSSFVLSQNSCQVACSSHTTTMCFTKRGSCILLYPPPVPPQGASSSAWQGGWPENIYARKVDILGLVRHSTGIFRHILSTFGTFQHILAHFSTCVNIVDTSRTFWSCFPIFWHIWATFGPHLGHNLQHFKFVLSYLNHIGTHFG